MKARVRRGLAEVIDQRQEIRETDGDSCNQIKGARSRSVSPRKRPAGQMSRIEEVEKYNEHDNDGYGRVLDGSSLCTPCGEELHRSKSVDAAGFDQPADLVQPPNQEESQLRVF